MLVLPLPILMPTRRVAAPTCWPMGMADRGSVLPGWMLAPGPDVMLIPARTCCGAST